MTNRSVAVAVCACLGVVASGASTFAPTAIAAPPAAAPAPAKRVVRVAPPKAPPPPQAPKPNVTLTLDAPSRGMWKMRVENAGDVPVRLTADARLLSLDVTLPNAKKPMHCALPADMRPTNDVDRALVLPPKRSYSEIVDPRLYCFGTSDALLTDGAKVIAHLGFRPLGAKAPAKLAPPFAVSPFDGVEPAVAPLDELVAEPVTLVAAEPATPAAPPSPPKAGDDPFPVKLALGVPKHVEASDTLDLTVTVTVTNQGSRPVTLLLRPETIGFDVIGPSGATRCSWPGAPGGAVREAFTTLAPKAKQSTSVLIGAVCPSEAFNEGGLFLVRPRLDTRAIDSDRIGVRSFSGEVIGATTTLMRIHHGRRPVRVARPRLD
jgi:hypothetical protein